MEQDLITAQALQQVSEKTRHRLDLLDDTLQAPAEQTDKGSTLMDVSSLAFSQIAALLFEAVHTSPQTIRVIVKQTAEKAGLGQLSSLDLRFTSRSMFSKAGVSYAGNSSSADS